MAITLIKSNTATGALFDTDGIADISWASGTAAAGNLVVVWIFVAASRTITSVVDEDALTYSEGVQLSPALGGGTVRGAIFYGRSAAAVSTITVTVSSATASPALLAIAEYGDVIENPEGTNATNTEASPTTTHNSGSVTTDQANTVVTAMSMNVDTATYTNESGWATAILNDQYAIMAHKILTDAGTEQYSPTTGGNVDSGNMIVWFKGTVAGGSGTAHYQTTRRLMLGIS